MMGLMDSAIAPDEREKIEAILNNYQEEGITWHALPTRQSGARRFSSVHILMPASWTIQQAHDLSERLEADIHNAVPNTSVFTHMEPIHDPAAQRDIALKPLTIKDN